MLDGLTSVAITTEATSWVTNFESILKVIIGVGLGFSVVRFVKNLFF